MDRTGSPQCWYLLAATTLSYVIEPVMAVMPPVQRASVSPVQIKLAGKKISITAREKASVSIIDIRGRTISRKVINGEGFINLKSFPSGSYHAVASTGKSRKVFNFFIIK